MSKFVELKWKKISEDTYSVECGYSKHYIHLENCDVINTLMFFSVMAFNNFIVTQPIDVSFWMDFLDYMSEQKNFYRNIQFENVLRVNFNANKKAGNVLFFSGGKDSSYSHFIFPEGKLIQYRVQVYKSPEIPGVETLSTNFDNELFHKNRKNEERLKLEMYLPIISPYRWNYIGIEKEIWDNGRGMLGYDVKKWAKILLKHNVILDSPVKEMYSKDILFELKANAIPFERCQATDKEHANEFCYRCEKCFTYYIQGCDFDGQGFDRTEWERIHREEMGQHISDLREHVLAQHTDTLTKDYIPEEKFNYFIKMIDQFEPKVGGKDVV